MALFRNQKPIVKAIFVFLGLFVAGLALNKCHGKDLGPVDAPYVQFDTGAAVIRGPAPVIGVTFAEPASVLPNAFWQESLTIIGTSKFRGQDYPNNAILRGLFVDGFGRFDVGLGVSWMVNPAPYNNPTGFNFNLQLDYRFKTLPLTLTYSHFSIAGMREPNLGRDLVMLGWRF